MIVFCVLLASAMAGLDYVTGPDITPSIFYLVPVVIGTWMVGIPAAMFIAAIGTGLWLYTESGFGTSSPSIAILLCDILARYMIFVIVIVIVTVARVRTNLSDSQRSASLDPVTNLLNRRGFNAVFEKELARYKRYKRTFSIALIDIDNFKQLNDRYGHHSGDAALLNVANIFERHTRYSDIVGRLDGDEFAICLPEADSATALACMTRIRTDLHATAIQMGWPITFSIGVASYASAPESTEDALKLADELMYAVKRSGKNGIRCGNAASLTLVPPGRISA